MPNIEDPNVHYFPISVPSPYSWKVHRELIDRMLSARELTAVVIQAGCSGAIPSRKFDQQPFSSWLPKLARTVPVFVIPDAPQPQRYPWRSSMWNAEIGCINLETAYSGIADEVVAKIIDVFKNTPDKYEAVRLICDIFKQQD